MICVGCKVDKTATIGTSDGEQRCIACHQEWIEPQTVGNIPAAIRDAAREELAEKQAKRLATQNARARAEGRSAAKAEVGSFDPHPNEHGDHPEDGYTYTGGIQYVPDGDGYW